MLMRVGEGESDTLRSWSYRGNATVSVPTCEQFCVRRRQGHDRDALRVYRRGKRVHVACIDAVPSPPILCGWPPHEGWRPSAGRKKKQSGTQKTGRGGDGGYLRFLFLLLSEPPLAAHTDEVSKTVTRVSFETDLPLQLHVDLVLRAKRFLSENRM